MTNILKAAMTATAVLPAVALAHNEHESTNVIAGLVHFFSSPDHLLTGIAVVALGVYLVRRNAQKDAE